MLSNTVRSRAVPARSPSAAPEPLAQTTAADPLLRSGGRTVVRRTPSGSALRGLARMLALQSGVLGVAGLSTPRAFGEAYRPDDYALAARGGEIYPYKELATLGTEFTFYHPTMSNQRHQLSGYIVENPTTAKFRNDLADTMREVCDDCTVTPEQNRYGVRTYNVSHPAGFWVNVATDPSTLETQMKPTTWSDFAANQDFVQELLFDSAKSLGAVPDQRFVRSVGTPIPFYNGGGHIHFGLDSTFHGDAKLLRNFLVDMQNNPHLSLGALGNYPRNAPPLAVGSADQRDDFRRLIAEFDAGLGVMSIDDLARRVNDEIHDRSLDPNRADPDKYQMINLQRAARSDLDRAARTVELRATRPQADMEAFLKVSELLLERIAFLDRLDQPIAYRGAWVELNPRQDSGGLFRQTADRKQRIVDHFYRYVTDIGLDWETYRSVMDPQLNALIDQGSLDDPRWSDFAQTDDATSLPNLLSDAARKTLKSKVLGRAVR